ncbi:hypothetical protein BLOT_012622 [Blomia tropicalis]|nr:hypothetical protein BLOT_012622 [Blomia tropicalis]
MTTNELPIKPTITIMANMIGTTMLIVFWMSSGLYGTEPFNEFPIRSCSLIAFVAMFTIWLIEPIRSIVFLWFISKRQERRGN